jgi:hypothetical protein
VRLTDAEIAQIGASRRVIPFAHLPCRAARLFSVILDRPVTCKDAIDALPRLRVLTDAANQRLRNPPVRAAD